MIATGEDAVGAIPAQMFNDLAYMTSSVPVRVLAGTHDLVVNNHLHGAKLPHLMPAASIEWLDGLGHMLHHFAPEAVACAVEELARLPS
ncbi:hypothetical protein GCM10010994_59450 [Chelatococcus reniformis]|uniref:Alpha/beta hydrolase n=2 Tax=Chelatococcus reniformis TaxID=1494448 RepID=A0A916UXV9_9HYPH|nr:hypothetical protein GCM10010994_59450 [Chelatococcus reniformis]